MDGFLEGAEVFEGVGFEDVIAFEGGAGPVFSAVGGDVVVVAVEEGGGVIVEVHGEAADAVGGECEAGVVGIWGGLFDGGEELPREAVVGGAEESHLRGGRVGVAIEEGPELVAGGAGGGVGPLLMLGVGDFDDFPLGTDFFEEDGDGLFGGFVFDLCEEERGIDIGRREGEVGVDHLLVSDLGEIGSVGEFDEVAGRRGISGRESGWC